jgi:hypothetical protein
VTSGATSAAPGRQLLGQCLGRLSQLRSSHNHKVKSRFHTPSNPIRMGLCGTCGRHTARPSLAAGKRDMRASTTACNHQEATDMEDLHPPQAALL